VVQQGGAAVPRRVGRVRDDVVAVQRGDRDEREVVDLELAREVREFGADLLEAVFVVVDEIHLVDAEHEVANLEK